MTNYDFLVGEINGLESRKKVKFFDVDLPEPYSEKLPVDILRKKMVEGDQGIELMWKEAKGFKGKGQAGFDQLTEMIGQAKNLKAALEKVTKKHSDPVHKLWKSIRNVLTPRGKKLDDLVKFLLQKQRQIGSEIEMERRKQERKAAEARAKLQAEIDAQQAKEDEKERERAEKENREPVYNMPIVVDTPHIPLETKTVTESGRAQIDMVLVPEITDLKSVWILGKVLRHYYKKYEEIAKKALEKAVKEGALGLKGAPGVTVKEEADVKHWKR